MVIRKSVEHWWKKLQMALTLTDLDQYILRLVVKTPLRRMYVPSWHEIEAVLGSG